MKNVAIASALFLFSSICFASDFGVRDATIGRIESAYTNSTMFTPESPFIASMLEPAYKANPGASNETWSEVRQEAATALSEVMARPGSILDTLFRASLEPLSDAELNRLESLLSDPVYKKFMASMAAPATQQKAMQAILGNVLQMNTAINSVLSKHALIQIH
jgi:hypothetical protein